MDLPTRAAIYCRLSFSPTGSVEKVERQEADCRALAAQLGWKVRDVYPDNSRSAWQRDRKRPQWDRMLTDIRGGDVDGIIVYHGDRLIRQPWDLELLLKLADDRQIPLAAPSGTRDLNNEDDRYALRIEAAQACRSSADTSRRVKRAAKARAESGRAGAGSNRTFGYGVPTGEKGKTGKPLYDQSHQVPEEAAIGREAVRRLLSGESQGGVIAWMNTQCATTKGNPWKANAFRAWLSSPRIAGLTEHDGTYYPAVWEPIISREEWEDAKAVLQRNSEEYGYAGRERIYLLSSGVAECGSCSGPLATKPAGRTGNRMYYCDNPACPKRVSRSLPHLDAYVVGRVLRRLNEPAFIAALHTDTEQPGLGGEIASLQRQKARVKQQIEELADNPDVDLALALRSLASFDKKITEIRSRMAATTRQRLLSRMAGITREQWDAEPVDVRAETVRALFRVIVLPVGRRGPGFDPAGVKMERRT